MVETVYERTNIPCIARCVVGGTEGTFAKASCLALSADSSGDSSWLLCFRRPTVAEGACRLSTTSAVELFVLVRGAVEG